MNTRSRKSNGKSNGHGRMMAAIGARYAEMIQDSRIVVRFRSGWHYVYRIYPAEMNCRPLNIGHARAKINADRIADEWCALDRLATAESLDQLFAALKPPVKVEIA